MDARVLAVVRDDFVDIPVSWNTPKPWANRDTGVLYAHDTTESMIGVR